MLVTTHSIFHCVRQLFGYQHSLKYFIKQIFPVLDSDWLRRLWSHCKSLNTHTHTHLWVSVTAQHAVCDALLRHVLLATTLELHLEE